MGAVSPSAPAARRARSGPVSGFTIFELILVMAVLVLAAAVVLPGFPAYARSAHLRGSAVRLASMARYAGEWATTHNRAVALGYDGERRSFTLTVPEETGEEELAAPVSENDDTNVEDTPDVDSAWRSLRLPDDVTLGNDETAQGERVGSGGQIRFLPDGSADEATLVLTAAQQSWTVRVGGPHGRVTLEAGDGLENGEAADGQPSR